MPAIFFIIFSSINYCPVAVNSFEHLPLILSHLLVNILMHSPLSFSSQRESIRSQKKGGLGVDYTERWFLRHKARPANKKTRLLLRVNPQDNAW